MDLKKYYFGTFAEYGKHKSSYLGLPAALVVLIAYCLPGIIGALIPVLANFSSLILLAVGGFEKKSQMVKLYCFQFCGISVISNIVLTVGNAIGHFSALISYLVSCLSLVFAVVILFSFFYSLFRAFQYKGWKMPFISEFLFTYFIKD
ncbi:MAG: hypothetical protein HUJ58_04850 [Erysipelotrichaceae bacterium]|nr:hypothetical protein [Erysipelotrichaceae bacterium]